MDTKKMRAAEAVAAEFIRRSQRARQRATGVGTYLHGSPETGALRRQSMELTRALSDLRKP